jgi:transposase
VVKRATVATTRAALHAYSDTRSGCRVVLEAGTHSPWVSRMLEQLGHEAVVAHPSAVYGPRRRKKRIDRMDAEFLARQGRADVQLLHPIQHRRLQAQEHRAVIRARDPLIRSRTRLINHVRGSVKARGNRIGRCSAESFPRNARRQEPAEMRIAVFPLLDLIAELTTRIHDFDRQIEQIVAESYPEALRLQQLRGVGA